MRYRLAIVYLGVLAPIIAAGDALFPVQQFPTGRQPLDIALADFDEDGLLDVVTVGGQDNEVTLLRGTITGGLTVGVDFPARDPAAMLVADIDANDHVDVLVVNELFDSLGVLLGDGDGSFGAATEFLVGDEPTAVAAGLLDAGGDLDVVVSNRDSDDVSVLLGTGDGSFAISVPYPAGDAPEDVVLADLDGNGSLDAIVAVGGVDDGVAVLLGNGDGSFAAPTLYPTANNPVAIGIADFDEDGTLDVIVVHRLDNQSNVSVSLGVGDGTLEPATFHGAGNTPVDVVIVDVDGDGHLDIVTALRDRPAISILFGDGAGAIGEILELAAGSRPLAIASGDLGSDGLPELVVANSNSNAVTVLSGRARLDWPVAHVFAVGATFPAVGDLNGDLHLDVVTAHGADDTFTIWLGDGSGNMQAAQVINTSPFVNTLTLDDLDANGTLDVITAHGEAIDTVDGTTANDGLDGIGVYLGNGAGGIASSLVFAADSAPQKVVTGDINGDDHRDVIVLNGEEFRALVPDAGLGCCLFVDILSVSAYLGDGAGNLQVEQEFLLNGVPDRLGIADFDGDGNDDVVADIVENLTHVQEDPPDPPPPPIEFGGRNHDIVLMRGSNIATFWPVAVVERFFEDFPLFSSPLEAPYPPTEVLQGIAVADWNADGLADIVFTEWSNIPGRQGMGIKLGDGNGNFGAAASRFPVTGKDFRLFDMDADGLLDVVSANAAGVQISTATIGGGAEPVAAALDGDYLPGAMAIGDFNEDGLGDILQVASDGGVAVRLARAGRSFDVAPAFDIGGEAESLALAHLDADGALDIVTANRNVDSVSIYRGSGGQYLFDRSDIGVGRTPQAVSTGDVNGDGFLDILTANQSDDTVSVLLGTGNTAVFESLADVAVGEVPAALAVGDLNGDTRDDVVVANVVGGTVSVLLGDAEAGLAAAQDFAASTAPNDVALADVDENGDLDVIVVGGSDDLNVLVGNGNGTLSAPVTYDAGFSVANVALGHIDGDGFIDAVVVNVQQAAILFGAAGGTFTTPVMLDVDLNLVLDVILADFDIDGDQDIMIVDFGLLRVLLGDGTGTFPGSADFSVREAEAAAVGDLNNDGVPDVVASTPRFDTVSVILNQIGGDTDGDGLNDLLEDTSCTFSADVDSDDDGLGDGEEDANGNGQVDPGETDPCNADSDGDGIQDGTEQGETDGLPDPDGEGLLLGTDPELFVADADFLSVTDPLDADSDGDGVADGDEDINGNGAVDAGESDPTVDESALVSVLVPLLDALGFALLTMLLAAVAVRVRRSRLARILHEAGANPS